MTFRVIVTLVFLNSIVLFSQEKITKHTIVKGETISSIAEKYEVKQSAIFKLNPNAKNLLKLNSVLLIPIASTKNTVSKSKIAINNSVKEHEVQAKETLYGIAKQYGISFKELNQVNPTLASSELKIGQKINIPGTAILTEATSKQAVTKKELATASLSREPLTASTDTFTWEVLPKETKYSITKKYGITIKEFDKANPGIGLKALRVGQTINIPGFPLENTQIVLVKQESKELPESISKNIELSSTIAPKLEEAVVSKSTDLPQAVTNLVSQNDALENNSAQTIIREVMPKETKYAIAKQYGITVQELEKQNPEVKNSFPVGYKLNIRSNNNVDNDNAIASTDLQINATIEISKIDFNNPVTPTFSHEFLDQLIERASENIGSRYRTGGTTKSGFDCSGLMCTTFGAFDIKLPRTSHEQSNIGIKINTEEAKKGDLIFFKTNGRSQINHVGMVVEVCEDEIKFIHSSVSNGVIISSTKEKYYQKNFSQINRVLQ